MNDRRKCLVVGLSCFTGVFFAACRNKVDYPSRIRRNEMMTQPLPEEILVLTDINQRRKKFPGAPLKVRGRVFDDRVQLDHFMWETTEFENCDFLGCTMLRGALGKVRFSNCLFVANRWDGGQWNDVTFVSCAWRGRFNMGVGGGTNVLRFEGCEFSGATPEEIGYGGRAEQYGIIGGTNGDVIYENCQFERMYINGGASLTLQQCTMRDVVIYAQDDARIFVANVVGKGLVNFGTGVGKFSSVSVKKSSFADSLVFESARIGSALFEDVTANLDLDIVTAESVVLRRMIFSSSTKPEAQFKYGLTSESAKIQSLRIEDCAFQGDGAALYLMGEKNRASAAEQAEQSLKKIGNVFSTTLAPC
jgi:hypothetical protein